MKTGVHQDLLYTAGLHPSPSFKITLHKMQLITRNACCNCSFCLLFSCLGFIANNQLIRQFNKLSISSMPGSMLSPREKKNGDQDRASASLETAGYKDHRPKRKIGAKRTSMCPYCLISASSSWDQQNSFKAAQETKTAELINKIITLDNF